MKSRLAADLLLTFADYAQVKQGVLDMPASGDTAVFHHRVIFVGFAVFMPAGFSEEHAAQGSKILASWQGAGSSPQGVLG